MGIHFRGLEILEERNMTQKELAKLTGIRPAGISELCSNQRISFNRKHIDKIAEVLNITDVRELFEFRS